MAPFQYEQYHNPYVNSISALIMAPAQAQAAAAEKIGAAQAQATQQSGQAWAGAIGQLGQIPAQMQQQKENALKTQALQQQVAAGAQSADDLKRLDDAFQKPGGRQVILDALPGHLRLSVAKQFSDADAAAATVQESQLKAESATTDYVHMLAEISKAHDYDPSAMQLSLAHAKDTFKNNPSLLSQVGQFESALQANPSPETVKAIVDPILSAHDAQEKPIVLPATPRGGAPPQLVKPGSGAVIATGLPAPEPPPPAPTEASLDARQQTLLAKLAQGTDLTAPEQAEVLAYQERKRTVSDPAQLAATERQTATIRQQIAQQQRAQDFQVSQVARKDLKTDEKTFTDAQASINTLRDVVDSAKSGNKIAASMQNLETAMAGVKAAGFNRINMAEIGIPGNAGNFLDSVKRRLGALTEGQPVPADLQSDMLKFADLLEKNAYKKYSDGFDSTAKYYNLSDQQKTLKLPAPTPTGSSFQNTPRVSLTPGLDKLSKRD